MKSKEYDNKKSKKLKLEEEKITNEPEYLFFMYKVG